MTTTTEQHTPGPWEMSRDAVSDWHTQISVYAEGDSERVATVFRTEANARLIAAAPELLTALEDARAILEDASLQWPDAMGLTDTDATIAGIERSEWALTLARVMEAIAKARYD